MKEKVLFFTRKLILLLGTIFTFYMLGSAFYPQDIGFYQSMFILGIVVLSGLLALKAALSNEKLGVGFRFWFQLSFVIIASIIAILTVTYLAFNATRLEEIAPFITDQDLVVGWFLIISLILLNWFHWGGVLSIVIAISVAYFFWGHLLPPPFTHAPLKIKFVMSYLGMDTIGGLFWMVPIAADQVYFLVLFATLLFGTGMLPLVIEMGKVVGNRIKGGAAFPAIIGSGMTGTVMGYAVSNVMLTGQLTIPMMKKKGFEPEFAGAIEATASNNGQIMPPIMGLSAFIIAVFLSIPYVKVALAAVLPAILNLLGVTIAILHIAKVRGYGYLNEPIDKGAIYNLLPTFLIAFSVVLVLLLLYISPGIAGIIGSVFVLITMFFRSKRFRPKFKNFMEAFENGYEIVVTLSLLLIAIGPIAQMATTTNLTGSVGVFLAKLFPESALFILFACMILSLIGGMGLPTPVAYLMVALLLIPSMAEAGFKGLAAHFFIMYFAIFSSLTPPVAVASLAASKLANAGFVKTSITALKIVTPTYIVPFIYVYHKELLDFPNISLAMIYWTLVSILLIYLLSAVIFNFFLRKLNIFERILFLISYIVGFVYIVESSYFVALMFFGLVAVSFMWIIWKTKKVKKPLPA
ncbi:MAG: TRAP transporter fused permease subunit [Nitrospirota bacterium]